MFSVNIPPAAAPIEHEHPQFPEDQRRYTYKAENYSNESIFTMFCGEPKYCTYVSPPIFTFTFVSQMNSRQNIIYKL